MTPKKSLEAEFLADHQLLTTGLRDVGEAVMASELVAARRFADHLDRCAGPHIDFEEHALYPALAGPLGTEFVAQLYREHDLGRTALEQLRDCKDGAEPDWIELHSQLRIVMNHVLSCGTLLSHTGAFTAEQRQQLLVELQRARHHQVRWTQVDRSSRPQLSAGQSDGEGP